MSDNIPPHYSPAIQSGSLVFTSGQLPILDQASKSVPDSIEDQTRLVLEKAEKVIAEFGLDRSHIIKTTAFITCIDDWGKVNGIYREFFGEYKPARSVIPTSDLHFGCLIELEAIAAIPS